MTTQEEQIIRDLTEKINNTPLSEKDIDAEQFLRHQLGRNPDAMHVLAQTVLVQQYALEQAHRQLATVRSQLEQQQAAQPKHATSFLGSLLGRTDDQPQTPPPPMPNRQDWAPVQQYDGSNPPQGGYDGAPKPYSQAGLGPQSGGFLRSAMQTATGVAAGALAFEGIESLLHGFGSQTGPGGGRPEEIINNYYGNSGPREHEHNLSSDIEDRRGESSSFSDAVDRNDHGSSDSFAFSADTQDLDGDTLDQGNDGDNSLDNATFDDDSSADDFSNNDDSF